MGTTRENWRNNPACHKPRSVWAAMGRKGGMRNRGKCLRTQDYNAGYSAGWHASKRSWLKKIRALQDELAQARRSQAA